MAVVRRIISALDPGGRIVMLKSDGAPFTLDDKKWVDRTITKQLRGELAVAHVGSSDSAALYEDDVHEGEIPRTGTKVRVHPLLHRLKRIIVMSGFRMSDLSTLIGRQNRAVSQYLRGESNPHFGDVVGLFGMVGYKLVPTPLELVSEVQALVDAYEKKVQDEIAAVQCGDADEEG